MSINAITSTGITTQTQSDLVNQFTTDFEAIYGSDITLTSDTPDGQMMMIFVQSVIDILNLIVSVFTMFDPDQAIGVVLDQRAAINGIQRQAATFTVTNITLVLDRSVNLYGLDQDVQPVYTVSDNAGNQWQLQTTHTGIGPSTSVLSFQSAVPGQVLTTPNTITTPVTVVLGVTSVNNPTTYSSLGVAEESDAAFKIRRQISTAIPSQGYYAGMYAALLNVTGVTSVEISENDSNATDIFGVPSHSIWIIIGGSPTDSDIANTIYNERSGGCGFYSVGDSNSKLYDITQADGTIFQVIWDTVVPQTLYIGATITSINGTSIPNYSAILTAIESAYKAVGANVSVNINGLSTVIQSADPNSLVTFAMNQGFSLSEGSGYANILTPTTKRNQFVVPTTSGFTPSSTVSLLPIILVAAGGKLAIVANVIVSTATVAHGGNTIQFSILGGRGTMVYSIQSGSGSINSSTGLYTSASIGTNVVLVTDADSNTAICTVKVT